MINRLKLAICVTRTIADDGTLPRLWILYRMRSVSPTSKQFMLDKSVESICQLSLLFNLKFVCIVEHTALFGFNWGLEIEWLRVMFR